MHRTIRLLTVEGSNYGPYVALPLTDTWTPLTAHLFTRQAAELIVKDLHRDDCGIHGVFAEDGTLLFFRDAPEDPQPVIITPDEHGRYTIGGLWPWDEWGDHVPHTAGQAAFARGAVEYRQADDSASLPTPLDGLYARGRQEAHRVTLRLDQP
ncbi:hypothetical protein ACH4VR_29470 [Streptomyces sp. NPDC020883]|uniref:hypothetical protein n=1 Tax=Streptomyces sp. NPDC020883 TaxID=3365099 RepID=UPI003787BD96